MSRNQRKSSQQQHIKGIEQPYTKHRTFTSSTSKPSPYTTSTDIIPLVDNNTENNKRKRDDSKRVISNDVLCRVFSFAIGNNFITTCIDIKVDTMFSGEWYVALCKGKKEILKVLAMDNVKIRRAIVRFEKDVILMLELFKFFGYYCIKDIESWCADSNDDYDTKLPFGLIDLTQKIVGEFYIIEDPRYPMDNLIKFQCNDRKLRAKYNYEVFNNGAKFITITNLAGGAGNMQNSYCDSMSVYDIKIKSEKFSALSTSSNFDEVMPVSRFIELYRLHFKKEEASDYEMDVAYQGSRPPVIVGTKPLPKDKGLDTLPADVYYSMDTLLDAVQVDNLKKQQYSLTSGISLFAKSRNYSNGQADCDPHANDGIEIRKHKKTKYNRADTIDGVTILPDSMEVAHASQLQKVIDVEIKEKNFELAVCDILGVPYQVVKPLSNISSSSSSSSQSKMTGIGGVSEFSVYQDLLYKKILQLQPIVNEILNLMYSQTYAILDDNAMDMIGGGNNNKDNDSDDDDNNNKKRYNTMNPLLMTEAKFIFDLKPPDNGESLKDLLEFYKEGVIEKSFIQSIVKERYGKK